ncbi:hypothetical protein [Okeania sp. SIO2B3]|nr:hypothetical protein [Okeania sp. SIO2B3]
MKKEEGRRKKEEGKILFYLSFKLYFPTPLLLMGLTELLIIK